MHSEAAPAQGTQASCARFGDILICLQADANAHDGAASSAARAAASLRTAGPAGVQNANAAAAAQPSDAVAAARARWHAFEQGDAFSHLQTDEELIYQTDRSRLEKE